MAADEKAGHVGSASAAVLNNQDNKAPADRVNLGTNPYVYDPANFAGQPGAAARANGYPRAS